MLHHPQLTERRLANFLANARWFYYEDSVPLEAEFVNLGLGNTEVPGELFAPPALFIRQASRKNSPHHWQKISAGERWGGNWETAWFRFRGRVPQKWEGKEVWAVLDTGSEACVFNRNGEPVCGLTSGDEWSRKALVPVAQKASGGEAVELLVEAVANHLFGVSANCYLKEARLVLFRRDGWEFLHDFKFLYGLMLALPEDHPRRAQIRYALNEAVNRYGGRPAPAYASLDPNGIYESYYRRPIPTPQAVSYARQPLREQLQRRANVSAPKVSAIGHSHLDLAWLWPLRETVRKAARTFSTALLYMREYPEYKFSASQAWVYEAVKKQYPELYERIKEAVKAQRWEPVGGMWVESDCNVTGGESLVRQFLYGKLFFLAEFGIEVDNMWVPDVFGYSAALPQIMRRANVKYFVTTKMSWNQFNKFPHHTFIWEGPDGSRVLAHLPPADSYGSDFDPASLLYATKNFAEKDRCTRWLYAFGYGDGGGGPSRHHLEFARRSQNCEELPRVKQQFVRQFFRQAETETKDLPCWKGELYLEFHRGTLTTQARNKKANRKAELLLREAEFLASFFPAEYPQEGFERVWKLLLLNQFHDIIPGSSIGWVYKDSAKHYEEITQFAQKVIADFGPRLLLRQSDGKKLPRSASRAAATPAFLVVNSLSWAREDLVELPLDTHRNRKPDVVRDAAGNVLPTQAVGDKLLVKATVPSLGYTLLRPCAESAVTASPLSVSTRSLENELLRVEFDRKGHICRIYDKEMDKEVIPAGTRGNVLAVYEDTPAAWEAWEVDLFYEEKPPQEAELVSCRVGEKGPLRASIIQERKVGAASRLWQQIRLAAGSRRLEFVTRVDWHESQKMLRTSFPVTVRSEQATYEIQFGHVQRPTHRNTSWDMAKFEVAAHRWADLSDPTYGVALLNDCKYGHKVLGNILDLNLLRSPKFPDPDADMGEHEFTYALFPHPGGFREGSVIQEGYSLNVPLRAFATKAPVGEVAQSLFRLNVPNVIVETIKLAEPELTTNIQTSSKSNSARDIVLRLYEAYGQPAQAVLEFAHCPRQVFRADLLERLLKEIKLKAGRLEFSLGPFEILTLRLVS